MLTDNQVERLVITAIQRGRREGMLLVDLARAARLMIAEIKEEPVVPVDQKQWFVIYRTTDLPRTFKAFGEDQDEAKDFATKTEWGLIAVIYDFPKKIWDAKPGISQLQWRKAS